MTGARDMAWHAGITMALCAGAVLAL